MALWFLAGLAGYVLLPWYFLQSRSLLSALPGLFGGEDTANGLVHAAVHGRLWLWSGLAGLLLAGSGLLLAPGRNQGRVLVAGAVLGLAGLLFSGFAIGVPGFTQGRTPRASRL